MTKILILSERFDYHGRAVRWGLDHYGASVDWWERSSFPVDSCISASVTNDATTLTTRITREPAECSFSVDPGRYKAIWNRRGKLPTVDQKLNKADQVVAKAESRYFTAGILSLIERANPTSLVVNSPSQSERAAEKLVQLSVARQLGFSVPETLVSNDPKEIRIFFDEMRGDVIAKQHIPFSWRNEEGNLAVPATSRVDSEMLQSDFALSTAPMIYQRCLHIDNEIRITFFGNTAFAITQKRKRKHDNRIRDIKWEEPAAERFDLSDSMRGQCREFMNEFNLNYATFDIAITPSGQQFFLEVNEAGQFLYMEERVPELKLLDAFCQFLASGDPDFRYKSHDRSISLSDFDATDEADVFRSKLVAHIKETQSFSPFELRE